MIKNNKIEPDVLSNTNEFLFKKNDFYKVLLPNNSIMCVERCNMIDIEIAVFFTDQNNNRISIPDMILIVDVTDINNCIITSPTESINVYFLSKTKNFSIIYDNNELLNIESIRKSYLFCFMHYYIIKIIFNDKTIWDIII